MPPLQACQGRGDGSNPPECSQVAVLKIHLENTKKKLANCNLESYFLKKKNLISLSGVRFWQNNRVALRCSWHPKPSWVKGAAETWRDPATRWHGDTEPAGEGAAAQKCCWEPHPAVGDRNACWHLKFSQVQGLWRGIILRSKVITWCLGLFPWLKKTKPNSKEVTLSERL